MPERAERKELSRIARRAEDRAVEHGIVPGEAGAIHRKRRGKTPASHPYGLEMRYRDDAPWRGHGFRDWTRTWKWYATAARRDAAMVAMNKADRVFEYRPLDRKGA